ncbi:MAG: trans-sulfuration enzyme family protein [Planctomycetota bacterium]
MATTPFLPSLTTRAARAGGEPDPTTGAVTPPIVQSTTFRQPGIGRHLGYTYSRADNPTVAALERCLGALEDAPPAVAFASGLAAETALFLATCAHGDHVVVSDVVYGGTVRLLRDVLSRAGIGSTFVDATDLAATAAAIGPRTRLLFVETPANPTLKLCDVAALAEVAQRRGVPLAVDNTFLTAAAQRPLELGAAVSLYSTTKLVEGHNGAIGGAIVARDAALLERLRWLRKSTGSIQSPHDAWLTLRGARTLPLRAAQQGRNALAVAAWLQRRREVAAVHYPGLPDFPQRELACRQHAGLHGTVVACELRGGLAAAVAFAESLRLCLLAESLGSVETLVTHPASMTHGDVPKAERERLGIADGLVRLSVGLEDPQDLFDDLDGALRAAEAGRG